MQSPQITKPINRDQEIQQIRGAIDSIKYSENAQPIYIHGPVGSGKSTVTHHATSQLQDESSRVTCVRVDCVRFNTAYKATVETVDQVSDIDVVAGHTPDALANSLSRWMAGHHLPPTLLVILEEFDRMRNPARFFELLDQMNERASGTIAPILLSSRRPEGVVPEAAIQRSEVIQFEGYEPQDIADILVEWFTGTEDVEVHSVQESAIDRIADAAVDRGSGCRFALMVLERAIDLASEDERWDVVTEGHVEEVLEEIGCM